MFGRYKHIDENTKMNQIRENFIFSNGSIVKKVYFFNNDKRTIIFLDKNGEVKYRIGSPSTNCLDKLLNLSLVNGELLNIKFFKEDLNLKMAYIYKLGLENKEDNAQVEVDSLIKLINNRKKLLKQFTYLGTPLIFTVFLFLFILFLDKVNFLSGYSFFNVILEYKSIIIFSGIGNFLSVSKNIKKIEFDTGETQTIYIFFSFFKYLTSLFSAILLVFLYNSNIINFKIQGSSTEAVIRILSVLGGFFENIVPNIFEKINNKII